MKALSVRQPWAALLRSGAKKIETRSWSTRYRGPLVICASAGRPTGFYADVARERGVLDAPLGVVMCLVDVFDVRPGTVEDAAAACADIEVGKEFSWCVRVIAQLDPVPVKGRLNFWEIDASLLKVNGQPFDIRPHVGASSRVEVPRGR